MLECPNKCCSIPMSEDVYCGRCGTKLVSMRKCTKCENQLFDSDLYCRKCGKPATQQALPAEITKIEKKIKGR